MITLWEIPDKYKEKNEQALKAKEPKIKLKKGETILSLIDTARDLVLKKLGKYKDTSRCVLNASEIVNFFNETPENGVIGIDTETTGLNVLTDKLVGISLCNGKDALYIPVNHISVVSGLRLPNMISEDELKSIFGNVFKTRNFKWVYHNAKFDLGVLRTFFGYAMPDPYWDTMLAAYLFNQDEEHSLLIWASY